VSSARRRVVVVGSFMMDLVATTPRLPRPGETVIGDGFERYMGGKGFNQAVAAARSGAEVAMVGCVGDDDFGRSFLDALDAEGIDRTGVVVHPNEGTGVGLPVVERSGQNAIVVVPRANHALAEIPAAVIDGAAVVLLQWELQPAATIAAARLAHDTGATVVLNPAPAVGALRDYDGLVDVIVPNEGEAATLVDLGGLDVVLTLGEKGAVVRTGGTEERLDPHEVECVDTVGAGDAFCGALCAAVAEGMHLVEAARYGNAAGALAVTRHGAEPSMPRRDEIEALLAGATSRTTAGG
jgi:ribokinase